MSHTFTAKNAHGLQLTHAVSEYPSAGTHRGSSDADVVRLHFALNGQYSVRYPTLERRFPRLGPHCSLFYAHPFDLEFVNQTLSLETFGVQFPIATFVEYADGGDDRISKFCDRIASGRASFLFEPTRSLPPAFESAIRRMLESRYDGALEELFLLSQSLELLVRALELGGAQRSRKPTRNERDKLFAARDFIDARLDDPPALGQIAKGVGLNDYKLKRGFKQLFGTSVFAYLTAQRLGLARRMLLDTDKTAAEVAFALGYATPQHFSQAFKSHFGVTPKSMRKSS